jgi:hypothetical protein
VVASRGVAFLDVHLGRDNIASLQTSFLDFDFVYDQALRRRLSIENNGQLVRWAKYRADVSDLPATLSVERRVIEHDLALVTFVQ